MITGDKPMEMMEIHNLIKEGGRLKAEGSLTRLRDEVETKTKALNDERLKLQAAEAEAKSEETKRAELMSSLSALEGVRSFIEQGKYSEAKQALVERLNEAAIRKEKVLLALDDVRERSASISRELDKLRDKMSLLSNPNYKSKYIDNECSIDVFLEECRLAIKVIHDECRLMPSRLLEMTDFVEMKLAIMLAAGNVRKKEEELSPLNSAEEFVFGKCYSILRKVAEDNKLGYVDPLNKKFNQNWAWFTSEQRRMLSEYQSNKRRIASPKKKNDAEDSSPSKDELAFAEALSSSGLPEKLSGKRVAVYGGKTRGDMATWLEDALKLKKVTWYEYGSNNEAKTLLESIKNNGVDVLVVQTQWMAHKHGGIIDVAKDGGVPVALCNSSSRKEFCMQLAYALGIRLDEMIRDAESRLNSSNAS